VLQAKMYSGVT